MTILKHEFDDALFSTYDIRGKFGENLKLEDAYFLGVSLGLHLKKQGFVAKFVQKIFGKLLDAIFSTSFTGDPQVVIGIDSRESSMKLGEAMVKGLVATGVDVVEIGVTPFQLIYYAVKHFEYDLGVFITGSGMGSAYNGFKITKECYSLTGEEIRKFAEVAEEGVDLSRFVKGTVNEMEIDDTYIAEALSTIKLGKRRFKIGIDALNGTAGGLIKKLTRKLPFEFILKNADSTGNFDEVFPNPTHPENIENLKRFLEEENLDMAFSFDGDADRLFMIVREVAKDGQIVSRLLYGDEITYLIARDIFRDENMAGKRVILDVKTSFAVENAIADLGAKVVLAETGHSYMQAEMNRQGQKALLGGDVAGHIYIADEFYGVSDGIYAFLRITSMLSREEETASEILAKNVAFTFESPEVRIPCNYPDEKIEEIKEFITKELEPERVNEVDGIKAYMNEGKSSILARVSNTQNVICLKCEAVEADEFFKLEQFSERIKAEIINR